MQIRQGDVLLEKVETVPQGFEPKTFAQKTIVAKGETTGHFHELAVIDEEVYSSLKNAGKSFLELEKEQILEKMPSVWVAVRSNVRDEKGIEIYVNEAGHLCYVSEQPLVLRHQEHELAVFGPGIYVYEPQREYAPNAIRNVVD